MGCGLFFVMTTGIPGANPCLSRVTSFFVAHFCVSSLRSLFVKTMMRAFCGGVFVLLFAMNATKACFHSVFCGVFVIVSRMDLMSAHSGPVSLCCEWRTVVSTVLFLYSSAWNHQA